MCIIFVYRVLGVRGGTKARARKLLSGRAIEAPSQRTHNTACCERTLIVCEIFVVYNRVYYTYTICTIRKMFTQWPNYDRPRALYADGLCLRFTLVRHLGQGHIWVCDDRSRGGHVPTATVCVYAYVSLSLSSSAAPSHYALCGVVRFAPQIQSGASGRRQVAVCSSVRMMETTMTKKKTD